MQQLAWLMAFGLLIGSPLARAQDLPSPEDLQLEEPEDEATPNKAAAKKAPPIVRSRGTAMIVFPTKDWHHNDALRTALAEVLKAQGYQVLPPQQVEAAAAIELDDGPIDEGEAKALGTFLSATRVLYVTVETKDDAPSYVAVRAIDGEDTRRNYLPVGEDEDVKEVAAKLARDLAPRAAPTPKPAQPPAPKKTTARVELINQTRVPVCQVRLLNQQRTEAKDLVTKDDPIPKRKTREIEAPIGNWIVEMRSCRGQRLLRSNWSIKRDGSWARSTWDGRRWYPLSISVDTTLALEQAVISGALSRAFWGGRLNVTTSLGIGGSTLGPAIMVTGRPTFPGNGRVGGVAWGVLGGISSGNGDLVGVGVFGLGRSRPPAFYFALRESSPTFRRRAYVTYGYRFFVDGPALVQVIELGLGAVL